MFSTRLRHLRNAFFSRDPTARNDARFQIVKGLAERFGFRVYNKNLYWTDDREALVVWRRFRPGHERISDRKFVVYQMARALAGVPGDTAECGVLDGGSSFLICERYRDVPGHRHHVFDSFEGLSQPSSEDDSEDPTAYRWRRHDLAVPLATVRENLREFDAVRYYPGWIPERFGEVADRAFSFVHVDVDLYQPTYDSIDFFYRRLVPGGIVLCDDYGSTWCPGARKAFDKLMADRPEKRVIELPTGQGFVVKRD